MGKFNRIVLGSSRRFTATVAATASMAAILAGCTTQHQFEQLPSNDQPGSSVAASSPTSPLTVTANVPTIQLPMDPASPSPSLSTSPSPSPSPSNTVCDPFGDPSTGGGNSNGLLANLTYIPNTSSVVATSAGIDGLTLASFLPGATDVVQESAAIFLSQLNVPTVDFTEGFTSGTGKQLADINGNALIEFFSLHISGYLQLNATDVGGDYQLAILSDDGSAVYLGTPGTSTAATQLLIDNDDTHANTLGCATEMTHLIPEVPVPIQVNYFQGPRYRIALMLLWRSAADAAQSEPFCGVREGDEFYFTQPASGPPDPTSNYDALLSRGWKPIPAANFYLPTGVVNPCVNKILPSPSPSPSNS